MKICLYDWALHSIGGGQRFDCKVAEHLSKHHNVDMLSLFPINKEKLEQAYGVDLSRIKNFRHLYRKSRLNPSLLHILSFRRVSRIAREYDLLYNAEEHETVKPNAKHNLLYCHFFELKWPKPAKNIQELVKLATIFIIKSLLRNYAKKYDAVYCNSQYTKKWLKRKWNVNAEVIYPPIDIPRTMTSQKKKNIILSTGRLTPDKNYEFTISCFKEIYDSGIKDYEFWVYGSEPSPEYLKRLNQLARGYPIKIIINPTAQELEEAYSKAKIFIQAKGLGINEKKYPALLEHFGMTPVEAMAHGAVPIVLNKGGYKESVENAKSGFLFNTKQEAVEKIKLLVNNQKLWKKLSKNAIAGAKKFSLERLHKELDRVMQHFK